MLPKKTDKFYLKEIANNTKEISENIGGGGSDNKVWTAIGINQTDVDEPGFVDLATRIEEGVNVADYVFDANPDFIINFVNAPQWLHYKSGTGYLKRVINKESFNIGIGINDQYTIYEIVSFPDNDSVFDLEIVYDSTANTWEYHISLYGEPYDEQDGLTWEQLVTQLNNRIIDLTPDTTQQEPEGS